MDKYGLRGCFDNIDTLGNVLKKNRTLGKNCNLFRVPLNDYDLGLDKESSFINPSSSELCTALLSSLLYAK